MQEAKGEYELRDDDVYLVSYPKSGNTWVRFLIGNYITNGQVDFSNDYSLLPDIHFNPEQIKNVSFSPRIIKSHFQYTKDYKRIIYIVRDGRQVALSLYYYLLSKNKISGLSFSEFLNAHFYTGDNVFGLGKWNSHVLSWLKKNEVSSILLIKYEDLHSDTKNQLIKILSFIGIFISEDLLKLAIEKSSFISMKSSEENNKEIVKKTHNFSDSSYGFVREGKPFTWRERYTEKEKEKFWDLNCEALLFLGYSKK